MPNEPTLHVCDATLDDLPTIVDFNIRLAWETEHKRLDEAVLRPGVEAALRRPEFARYFVARIEGQTIGQIMLTYEWSDWRNGMLWWIQSVYVREEFRRRGVYRALHERVVKTAQATPGVGGLRLYVEQENRTAQATYVRLGMRAAGYAVYEQDWTTRHPGEPEA